MSAIVAVARADFRERTRTFALIVVIAATLQAGFLFVPDASASYSTIDFGGWRGFYDSAYMGAATALLTVSFLPFFGFFLVRPALSRDAHAGTYEIVAASPLGPVPVVLGKWLSNTALLVLLAALLLVAAVAMQLLRGEDRAIDPASYLLPFALFSVPTCAITAACAIVIDAAKPLRSIGGGVTWFFVCSALFTAPMLATGGRTSTWFDPFGVSNLTSAMFSSLHEYAPGANLHDDISIGVSDRSTHQFRFAAIGLAPGLVALRAAWFACAALAVCAVARFALAAPTAASARPRRLATLPARIVQRLPLSRLVRAELGAALGSAGPWWLLGAFALAAAALVVPAEALARVVAPLVWIWPVGPVAAATVIDARANLDGVLLATPTAPWRRIAARWTACTVLAIVPVLALALRSGAPGVTFVALACALAALAILLGTLTRAPLAFESLALIAWYLGPVNRLPLFDPSAAAAHALFACAAAAVATVCALAIASARIAQRS